MASWQLIFPANLDEKAVIAFLGSLHGLARSRFDPLDRPAVIFETDATRQRVRQRLVVADRYADTVQGALLSTIGSVRLEADDAEPVRFTSGIEVTASTTVHPLRMDQLAASATTVLSSLLPLSAKQMLRLQWVLAPAPSPKPPKLAPKAQHSREPWWFDTGGLADSETVRAQRRKQTEPLFLAVGRIAVAGAQATTARRLQHRVLTALRRSEAPGVRLRRRAAQLGTGLDGRVTADIRDRDRRDQQRAASPLRPAADAIEVDTGTETPAESLARILALVRQRLAEGS